jgi:hypothetical protein
VDQGKEFIKYFLGSLANTKRDGFAFISAGESLEIVVE